MLQFVDGCVHIERAIRSPATMSIHETSALPTHRRRASENDQSPGALLELANMYDSPLFVCNAALLTGQTSTGRSIALFVR
jgi:hypothetical protein